MRINPRRVRKISGGPHYFDSDRYPRIYKQYARSSQLDSVEKKNLQ